MLVKIWAWLTGGELVWLKDHDGEVSLSIAQTDPWGEKIAYRYWLSKVRLVVLLADGKVAKGAGYVELWKPYNA